MSSKMDGNAHEVTSTPLDLSKKPSGVTSGNKPKPVEERGKVASAENDVSSSALDLTKPTSTVSFHRAIPVTTTVPSRTSHKALGGSDVSQYSLTHMVGDRKEERASHGLQVEPKSGSPQVHDSVLKAAAGHGYPVALRVKEQRVVVTAAETTSKLEEGQSIARLSPSTLTYQQQSVMRNLPEIDSVEPAPRLIQGGVQTVIVANNSGYVHLPSDSTLVARTSNPEAAVSNLNSGHSSVVVIPMSELKRIQNLQTERELAVSRDEGEQVHAKTKPSGDKRRVQLAPHFQPYPNQRPAVTTLQRTLSIPSHTIQAMTLNPRVSTTGSEGSISPSVLVRTSLGMHPTGVIQGWSGAPVTTSGTSDSNVALTFSVLGTPKVATTPPSSKGTDGPLSNRQLPKQDASSAVKSSPSPGVVAMPTGVSGTDSESSDQGPLPINPFYPLSVAVDCHRATAQDADGDTPLHIAIVQEQTDLAYIQRLIHLVKMSGKTLDIFNYMQQTPLHLAAITNNIEVIRIMLEAGANPNEADRNGQTTIHHACCNRNSPCMSVIFKYSTFKIDLEKKNFNGHTPLHVAVDKRDKVLVRMLLEHGANVNAMDSRNGWTPLFIAVANQDIGMIGILVEFRAKVNAQSYSGNSALHIATGRGYTDVVKVMVQYGADLSLKNSHWETPVNVANVNANEMGQLLRRICRGSPTAALMAHTVIAAEKLPLPPLQASYPNSYSPPPAVQTSSKPTLSSSHEDVRNALSNKIHRKLSRDGLTPSSPVSGRDSPNFRKRIKTTKVVKVAVDGDSFPLGKLTPISDGHKISVITKSNSEPEQRLQSNDSGIGSWRTDSDPRGDIDKIKEEKMDTSSGTHEDTGGPPVLSAERDCVMDSGKDENTVEFNISSGFQTLSEGARVTVEKVNQLPMTAISKGSANTWEERMEVDIAPPELKKMDYSGSRSGFSGNAEKLPDGPPVMRTIDGSPLRMDHMFGTPPGSGQQQSSVNAKVTVRKEDHVTGSNSGFDVTAVPVYRKAMQNGAQMSKTKEKIQAGSASTTGRIPRSSTLSGMKRHNSQDSDEDDKLVIVEMRTKPLKKTMSSSCPTSPSLSLRSAGNEQRLTPSPKRALET